MASFVVVHHVQGFLNWIVEEVPARSTTAGMNPGCSGLSPPEVQSTRSSYLFKPHQLPTLTSAHNPTANLNPRVVVEGSAKRYRLTPFGLKTALFYSRAYQRLLRRGLSDLHDPRIAESSTLALNFVQFQKALDAYVAEKMAA